MTVAESVIKPRIPGIFRIVFLYTGQGESTLLVIPTGPRLDDYKYVLVDSDQDREPNEIDLVALFKDLFRTSGSLSIFINTHPHNDHIGGIKEIYDEIGFDEVWHSNHKPGGKHRDKYKALEYVIKQVGKTNEFHLKGTNDLNKIRNINGDEIKKPLGLIDYVVLSPAEYLCDDIDDADADERYKRIHEQCGVIKFSYGDPSVGIMITGDSDKTAWQDHITDYHIKKLPSVVLSASHHGSRTFFKDSEDDKDVYESHIAAINPKYIIISAPRQEDSAHGHPHDDALQLYAKYVVNDNILHLGKKYESVIVDIFPNGRYDVRTDRSLVETYGGGGNDEDPNKDRGANIYIGSQTSRIDDKPMG